MATYSSSAAHYAWGDGNSFPPWHAPEQPSFSLRSSDATPLAWALFSGATALLGAASISAATLTISGLSSPATGSAEITIRGDKTPESPNLPLDHDEAVGRTLTTAEATVSLDGLTTVDVDVAAVLSELRAASLSSGVIQLYFSHPTNDEAGLEGLTVSLFVEYTPGDAVVIEDEIPELIAEWSIEEVSLRHRLPELIAEWSIEPVAGTTAILDSIPELIAEWSIDPVTGTTAIVDSIPELIAEWSIEDVSLFMSIPELIAEWSIEPVTGTTAILDSIPELIAEWSIEPVTGTTAILDEIPELIAEWSIEPVTGTTAIVDEIPELIAEWQFGGVYFGVPKLRAVRRGQVVLHCHRPFSSAPETPGNTGIGGVAVYLATAPAGEEPSLYYRRLTVQTPAAVPAWPPHPNKSPAVAFIDESDSEVTISVQPSTAHLMQLRTWRDDRENLQLAGTQTFTTDADGNTIPKLTGSGHVLRLQKLTGGGCRIYFAWTTQAGHQTPLLFRLHRLTGPTAIADVTIVALAMNRHYSIDVAGLQHAGSYTFRLTAERGSVTVPLLAAADSEETAIAITGDSAGPPAVTQLTADIS